MLQPSTATAATRPPRRRHGVPLLAVPTAPRARRRADRVLRGRAAGARRRSGGRSSAPWSWPRRSARRPTSPPRRAGGRPSGAWPRLRAAAASTRSACCAGHGPPLLDGGVAAAVRSAIERAGGRSRGWPASPGAPPRRRVARRLDLGRRHRSGCGGSPGSGSGIGPGWAAPAPAAAPAPGRARLGALGERAGRGHVRAFPAPRRGETAQGRRPASPVRSRSQAASSGVSCPRRRRQRQLPREVPGVLRRAALRGPAGPGPARSRARPARPAPCAPSAGSGRRRGCRARRRLGRRAALARRPAAAHQPAAVSLSWVPL